MPWLYVDADTGLKGQGAEITDDDSEVIGLLTNYSLDIRQDPLYAPVGGVLVAKKSGITEVRAVLDISVTDLDGWLTGFHRPLTGQG